MSAASPQQSPWQYRAPERRLFFWALLTVAVAYGMLLLLKLGNAPALVGRDLLPLGVFLATLVLLHLGLVLGRSRSDPLLLPPAMLLGGIGIAAQLRLRALDLEDPTRIANYAYPLGVVVLLLTGWILGCGRVRWLQRGGALAWLAASAVLAGVLVLGQRFRGAVFLPGNVNPAEVTKVLLVLFLAAYLARRRGAWEQACAGLPAPPWRSVLALGLLWVVPMSLLVLQRDLGMLVLLNGVLVVMLFIATRRRGYLLLGGLAVAAGLAVMFRFAPHARYRILAWLNPFSDPTGRGWQVLQSLSALYCGGLWGLGLGTGSPHAIPIASSDFVYAVLGEEIGFLGCVLLLATYGFLFQRCFRVAEAARDPFTRLLAGGLSALLALQTLLNIGGVTKAIPLTGMTLPFISHGGSSLVTSFLALGLLLGASSEPASRRKRGRRARPGARRRPGAKSGGRSGGRPKRR